MATEQPAETVAEHDAGDPAHDDKDDFTPSPREAFHTDPQLCKDILRTAVSTFPLEIRPSQIAAGGSGLFATVPIDAGREIYRSTPVMAAVDAGHKSVCHHCLRDARDGPGPGQDAKACTGCKVAHFCSKECQKAAWSAFHKDECRILRKSPKMMAVHLLVHRLVFWEQRKLITPFQARVISLFENNFNELSKDGNLLSQVMGAAAEIRNSTGGKAAHHLLWKVIPALRVNCVKLRPATKPAAVGNALDLLTATINHSCDPNAFVFYEGRELRARSLRKIAPGEEITICYVDPTIFVHGRRQLLQRVHFFECSCTRCESESREEMALVRDRQKLSVIHDAQRNMMTVISGAVEAFQRPGVFPQHEDLHMVEARLRTVANSVLPMASVRWPEDMDPLPAARLTLAMLHFRRGQRALALRNALKGKLVSRRRAGPEWVNEMFDVNGVLLRAAGVHNEPAGSADEKLPSQDDLRTVVYGYLYETCREAAKAFGGQAEYTRRICDMFATMVERIPGPRPGSREFGAEFVAAQRRLMAWAAVPEKYAISLSC